MFFIRLGEVAKRSGYTRQRIMQKANDPDDDFPTAVPISEQAKGFVDTEFEAWQQRRLAERDAA